MMMSKKMPEKRRNWAMVKVLPTSSPWSSSAVEIVSTMAATLSASGLSTVNWTLVALSTCWVTRAK